MSRTRSSKSRATRRHTLDPDKLAPVLAEMFPVGDGELPTAVDGWFDRQGRPRRVRADYPNGWRIEFRLSVKRTVTSSSASIRLVTKGKPA